jgi:hypothetical protein
MKDEAATGAHSPDTTAAGVAIFGRAGLGALRPRIAATGLLRQRRATQLGSPSYTPPQMREGPEEDTAKQNADCQR